MRLISGHQRPVVLFLSLLVLFTSFPSFAKTQYHNQYRQFLMKLGFEDQSAELRQSLADKNFLDPEISEKVLTYQAQRYEVFNDVREVAIDILETLHENNLSEAARKKLVNLAVKLVTTKPLRPPTAFPQRIENAPAADREALKLKFAIEVTRENIERQTEILMADIVGSMHGKERIFKLLQQLETGGLTSVSDSDRNEIEDLKLLQQRLGKIVRFMYLDEYMGAFSVTALGKALILGMTRFEMREGKGGHDLIKEMKSALKAAGTHYENYVGTKLKVKNHKGEIETVSIENGDFVMERSLSKEALDITSAPRPGGIRNYVRAMRLGLAASVIANLMVPKPDEDTAKLGRFKRALHDMRKAFGELKAVRQGFSHIGMAEVLSDDDTGLQTTRVLDNYPDPNGGEGGVRVTDFLHEFAKEGEFMRLGVARFNADKYYAYAHENVFKTGYKNEVWLAHTYDAEGKVVDEGKVPWKTTMSEAEFNYLYGTSKLNAKEFLRYSAARAVQEMHSLKRQGIGFGYGFRNKYGEGYCTFTNWLAWARSLQVDVQPVWDRWHLFVIGLNRAGVGDAADMRMQDRIMAPGGIAWQTQLVNRSDVQIVDYPAMKDHDREELLFQNHDSSLFPEILRGLRRFNTFLRLAQTDEIDQDAQGTDWTHVQRAIENHQNQDKFRRNQRGWGRANHPSGYLGILGRALGRCEDLLTGNRGR